MTGFIGIRFSLMQNRGPVRGCTNANLAWKRLHSPHAGVERQQAAIVTQWMRTPRSSSGGAERLNSGE
jgi:hypothetical protein